MNHIFISYSRRDGETVNRFVQMLRDAGYSVWQDNSGAATGIPFSTRWMDVIIEALYTAEGAIVFRSPAWQDSAPCRKEFELIQKCDMPYLELTPSEVAESPETALGRVKQFYDTELDNSDNLARTALFSSSYAYKNGVDPYQLIKYTRTADVRKLLKYLLIDMKRDTRMAGERNYEQLNPDIYPAMQDYLSFAKKAAIRSLVAVVIGLMFSLVMIIFLMAYAKAIPMAIEESQATYADMAYAGEIERTSEADPVKAMAMAANFSAADLQASFTILNHNATRLEHVCLPEKVLLKASEEDIVRYGLGEENRTSSKYTADISDTGTIVVTDAETGVSDTVSTPAAVDGYAWNKAGDKLVYWCGSRVFIYNPQGGGRPVELEECFQKVRNAAFSDADGQITAVTDSGSVLVWRDPLADQVQKRKDVDFGRLYETGGQPAAVYISGNKIIANDRNKEYIIETGLTGKISTEGFAVSHDSSRVAVVHRDGGLRVAIVELSDGNVVLDTEMPVEPASLVFSRDDRYVFAAGSGCGLMRLDTQTGEILCSDDNYYMHNLALYGDKLVVTDYNGGAIIFDQDLRPQSDFGRAANVLVPFLYLDVAENNGYLFTVNRGGGESIGCARYDLETGKINLFMVNKTEKVASNTAVAVSPDEEYVAYGYPDGTIRIYETRNMYLAGKYHDIGEAVTALRFGSDFGSEGEGAAGDAGSIYALGRSGTIYTLDITTNAPNDSLEIMQANWKDLQARLKAKVQNYEDGIQE